MKTPIVDIAWAAGLFEGEGSMGVSHGRYVNMQLAMADEDIVRRFHRTVRVGAVHGPYVNRGTHGYSTEMSQRKPMWHWSIRAAKDVHSILDLFFPYLGDRRAKRAREILGQALSIRPHSG